MIGLDELMIDDIAPVEQKPYPPFNDVPTSDAPADAPIERKHRPSFKGILHFDLETIPDYDRMESFDLPPIPDATPRTPLIDCPKPETVLKGTLDEFKATVRKLNPDDAFLNSLEFSEKSAQKPRKGVFDVIDELRGQDAARESLIIAQRKQMSVTPEMCKIVAFGYLVDNGVPHSLIVGVDGMTERDLLCRFWAVAGGSRKLCGFNVLGFDLPVIFTRSIILDVAPPRHIDLKPWGNDVIDLMAKRWPKGPATGLKKLAKQLGIPIPAGDIDGSQTEQLLKDDPAKLGEYVRSDVHLVEELYRRYSGFFF